MKNDRSSKGEIFTEKIDFFKPYNQPLKQLSEKDQFHISRHIPGASYPAFLASVRRQQSNYTLSTDAWIAWEYDHEKDEPRPSIVYPCSTCMRIAKKLGI